MKGWLIYNKGFANDYNLKQYKLYELACAEYNIELELKTNFEIHISLSEKAEISDINFIKPHFVIFLDKDIMLAKQLELLGFKVLNSSKCIENCDNKNLSQVLFAKHGVKTPKTITSKLDFSSFFTVDVEFNEFLIKQLGFPMVVKEAYGSFGQQVYLVNGVDELINLQERIYKKEHLYQEFISSSYGKDVRVYVVGKEVVASVLRYNDDDFRANITNGGNVKEYEINDKIKEIAIKAVQAVEADFAGVDILFGENNEPILCEVNSNAYFLGLYSLNGTNIAKQIIEFIYKKLITTN